MAFPHPAGPIGDDDIQSPPTVDPEDRVWSKGTHFWFAVLGATVARLAGIKSISGPNFKRDVVDATELDQSPASLPTDASDEMYYYKHWYPGTKEVDPVTCNLNMSLEVYQVILNLYDRDAFLKWELRFRPRGTQTAGAKLSCATCFIETIGTEIEEASLVIVPVTFRVSGKLVFTPGSGP